MKALKEEKRKAEEAGGEGPDLAGLGPPFLHLFLHFLRVATGRKEGVSEQDLKVFQEVWDGYKQLKGIMDIEGVSIFRYRALKTGNGGHRLQMSISHNSLGKALRNTMILNKWELKKGPAPRGALERQVQEAIDRRHR